MTLSRVTKSRVVTPEAAGSTKRKRSTELASLRETISGGTEAASVQLQEEIGKEGRKKLMLDPGFAHLISAEESLLMKTNMGLPWHKIRLGRRYRTHNISIHITLCMSIQLVQSQWNHIAK